MSDLSKLYGVHTYLRHFCIFLVIRTLKSVTVIHPLLLEESHPYPGFFHIVYTRYFYTGSTKVGTSLTLQDILLYILPQEISFFPVLDPIGLRLLYTVGNPIATTIKFTVYEMVA